jgi:hypothetical protein
MSGHPLTCQRCGRPFTARRSDARYCSRSCRRRSNAPMPVAEPVAGELEDGWRRVGRYLIPPADPRLTFRVD